MRCVIYQQQTQMLYWRSAYRFGRVVIAPSYRYLYACHRPVIRKKYVFASYRLRIENLSLLINRASCFKIPTNEYCKFILYAVPLPPTKKYFNDKETKERQIFLQKIYMQMHQLKLVHLFFVNNFEFHSLFKTPQKKSKTWNAYQHILYACYVSFTYYACSTPQVTTLTHKHMTQPYCMDMLPMSSDIVP